MLLSQLTSYGVNKYECYSSHVQFYLGHPMHCTAKDWEKTRTQLFKKFNQDQSFYLTKLKTAL